ncbi:MAG: amidohydrolase family protein [Chitinophagaceae bacterium]|jgi:imidazolonepropionase-like amidohydrolase|nr:amidohydrolase family protein [Chitinophagaceae bacterium]
MKKNQLFLLLCVLSVGQVFAQTKALVGGTLIDGYGGKPIHNSVIIIEGETIKQVGRMGEVQVPKGAEIISTEGMSVLPGLWDMHVHMMINGHSDYAYWDKKYPPLFEKVIMPASAYQLLMAGVTSARDLGGPLQESIAVRDAINQGKIPGATMYVSGPFLQHRPYPGTEQFRWGIYGEKDAREKVQQLAKAGVDCIKLIDQDEMTKEEVFAIVDEAHRNKLKVVGHSHRPNEIRIGLEAGVDNFEHTGLSSSPSYPEDITRAIAERTAKMSMGPLYWTPTVEGLYNYEDVRDNPEKLDDDSWHRGLPDSVIRDIRQSISRPGEISYFQLTPIRKPTLETKFKQLQKAGVVLLIGTDSGIPMKFHSQSTWNELDIWVRVFGVDPLQAIKSATYWPSVFMGVDRKVGTVSAGKQADIIAVKGDVLKYINLLQRVDLVMKKGKIYKK